MKKEHKALNSIYTNCFSAYNNQFYNFFSKESGKIVQIKENLNKLFGGRMNIASFILLLLLLMTNFKVVAQSNILEIESEYFNTGRSVYFEKSERFDSAKSYQLFVVLDEPVLFEYT